MIRWIIIRGVSAAFCLAAAGLAATEANASESVNVTIKGVVITPPPCTINTNNTIDVDFGNAVDVNKVDGKNYLKPVNYTLECAGTITAMKMSITGTAADFDDGAALDAGHGGLGIELQQGGEKLALGKEVNFTWPDFPVLQAVPVKKSGASLETGDFSVGATMIVDWQ